MIGDAPGDYRAAKANQCLFFPINPGREEASWQRLFEEGIEKASLERPFAGEYQTEAARGVRQLLARNTTVGHWIVGG